MENNLIYSDIFKQTKLIYSYLEDDLSKRIFEKKLEFSATGSAKSITDLIEFASFNIKNKINIQNEKVKTTKYENVVIYGTSDVAIRLYKNISKYRDDIMFCEKNDDKSPFSNVPFITPKELITKYKNSLVFVCPLFEYRETYSFLYENGFLKEQLDDGLLIDEDDQYFDELVKFSENEVFYDIGSFDGKTALNFVKKVPNYKRVFSFEADSDNYNHAVNNLKNINVDILNIGLWNEKATLKFSLAGSISCKVSDVGDVEISVDSLDSITENNLNDVKFLPPTFLKMDIEGAELEALIGAKKTIETYKPKLAISIYHKPEDIIVLIEYIKKLVPEYKLYLRHYTNWRTDTVLYAII